VDRRKKVVLFILEMCWLTLQYVHFEKSIFLVEDTFFFFSITFLINTKKGRKKVNPYTEQACHRFQLCWFWKYTCPKTKWW